MTASIRTLATRGRRRTAPLSAADAAALGVVEGDLIELVGKNPAPLRAWVRIAATIVGTYPLDDFARKVLGVLDGDRIMLRSVATPPLPGGMKFSPADNARRN